jgi:hypothetical protein
VTGEVFNVLTPIDCLAMRPRETGADRGFEPAGGLGDQATALAPIPWPLPLHLAPGLLLLPLTCRPSGVQKLLRVKGVKGEGIPSSFTSASMLQYCRGRGGGGGSEE